MSAPKSRRPFKTGVGNLRPANRDLLLYPAIHLFLMIDMQQWTFFCGLRHRFVIRPKKRPKFLARTFFFGHHHQFIQKKGLNFWQRPFDFDLHHRFVCKKAWTFSFGPLEWWRPTGTLLGLNVATSSKNCHPGLRHTTNVNLNSSLN